VSPGSLGKGTSQSAQDFRGRQMLTLEGSQHSLDTL
jgi:hypothetical protein